ncbi:hypothetical protein ABKN59_007541 [Abortiporus biennis]
MKEEERLESPLRLSRPRQKTTFAVEQHDWRYKPPLHASRSRNMLKLPLLASHSDKNHDYHIKTQCLTSKFKFRTRNLTIKIYNRRQCFLRLRSSIEYHQTLFMMLLYLNTPRNPKLLFIYFLLVTLVILPTLTVSTPIRRRGNARTNENGEELNQILGSSTTHAIEPREITTTGLVIPSGLPDGALTRFHSSVGIHWFPGTMFGF